MDYNGLEENPVFAQDFNLFLQKDEKGLLWLRHCCNILILFISSPRSLKGNPSPRIKGLYEQDIHAHIVQI